MIQIIKMMFNLPINVGRLTTYGFLLAIIISISGCTMYENVTGYFNTYYNAKKLFSDAEREIEKTPQKERDTNYFAAYNVPKGVHDKLDKVIEKCSKLIQLYPRSSWLEDAIVTIGKSYVYKGETESAIRKFNELIENFPTSDLTLTARLWKAKALYSSNKDDEAILTVDELLPDAEKDGEKDIMIEALMLKGQIQIDREDYKSAAEVYGKAINISGSGDLLAIAQYQLGICESRLGNYREAAEAFINVENYNPTITKKYQAQLRAGMMLSISGQHEKALEVLENLRSQALKSDEKGMVELEIANTYKRMNDTTTAFTMYDRIDSVYKKTDAAAKSYYERGLSYENDYKDYRKALSFYEKAKAEFPSSEITPIAQKKVQYLTQYFKLHDNLIKFDSLLVVKTKADSLGINNDSLQIAEDTSKVENIPGNQVLEDTTALAAEVESQEEIESYDILDENLEPLPEEHSLLEARTAHSPLISSPTASKAKRDEEIEYMQKGKSDETNLAKGNSADSLKSQKKAVAADQYLKVSSDSLKKLISQTKFELGVLFLLDMKLSDSALTVYWNLVENYPESKYTPRAYYSMAEIYRERNDSLMVDSLYKIILDKYDQTEYANQVKRSLGLEIENKSIEPADSLYAEGEKLLNNGDVENACKYFEKITVEYPSSNQAPKALYALGWIQEVVLINNDSAASIYQKLIKDYPNSIYAAEVKPKLAIKEDPKTVDKYIKINEIQVVTKTAPPKKEQNKPGELDKNKQPQEQLLRDQFPDEEPSQDEEEPEEEEPDNTDDGG